MLQALIARPLQPNNEHSAGVQVYVAEEIHRLEMVSVRY